MNATVTQTYYNNTNISKRKGKGEGRHLIYNSKILTNTKLKMVIM